MYGRSHVRRIRDQVRSSLYTESFVVRSEKLYNVIRGGGTRHERVDGNGA